MVMSKLHSGFRPLKLSILLMSLMPATSVLAQPAHVHPYHQSYTQALLGVTINGEDTHKVAFFLRSADGRLFATQYDLKQWGFRLVDKPVLHSHGQLYYSLNDFPGTTFKLNPEKLTVAIKSPPTNFIPDDINFSPFTFIDPPKPNPGGFFNYDTSAQKITGSNGESQVGGLFEAGFFNRYGVGTNDFLVQHINNSTQTVRLNTTWTDDDPANMRTLRLGDAYSQPAMWGQSVGFGGIQFATNFSTQPSFITFPLPSATGEAVVPSSVNLFVNNALTANKNVNTGPFAINNIPVVTGYGSLNVVTTDLLGRQQILSVPYYASATLLKPGLHDYSFEAGFIRDNFGIDSNDYGRFMMAGTDSVGITERFTGQWHAEALADQQTAGVGADYLLSTIGVLNAGVAGSHDSHGAGGLGEIGFQRQAWNQISFGVNAQATTHQFMELGIQPGQFAPSLQSQAFLGVPLDHGASLGMSYTLQNNRCQPSASLFNVSYSRTFFKSWSFNASAITNVGGEDNKGVFVTVSHLVANDTTVYAGVNDQQSQHTQEFVQLNRPLPFGTGYGYNVSAASGHPNNYQASLSAQNTVGTYTVAAANEGGSTGYRAEISGGAVYLGGDGYLSRQVTNSFGVVQVGYPNVRVYEFNQFVARTDKHGNVLLPYISPYQDNSVTIDPNDLPLNTQIEATEMDAIPYYRSGVLVRFPIQTIRSATLKVTLPSGEPIPAGAMVTVNGKALQFPVGNDGQLYVTGLALQNSLSLRWDDQSCQVNLTYPKTSNPLPNLGSFTCYRTKTTHE
jgi:outer membrane usher protein